jgi:hypothetical protein
VDTTLALFEVNGIGGEVPVDDGVAPEVEVQTLLSDGGGHQNEWPERRVEGVGNRLDPGLAPIVFAVAGGWMLIAMVIAVRQALDYKSTWRAFGVCVIGWVIQAVVLAIAISMFGSP